MSMRFLEVETPGVFTFQGVDHSVVFRERTAINCPCRGTIRVRYNARKIFESFCDPEDDTDADPAETLRKKGAQIQPRMNFPRSSEARDFRAGMSILEGCLRLNLAFICQFHPIPTTKIHQTSISSMVHDPHWAQCDPWQ